MKVDSGKQMGKSKAFDYDVIFLGGGLSSGMMGRYLKRKHPELEILVLEKNTKAHWNPGESTVGVAGFFMIRDLGLSTYLYLNQLPKNGLRYFFHDPEKEFDFTKCSEIGSNILPIFPTFQVDRARLDEDLWKLNSEIGITTRLGSKVTDIQLGEGIEAHAVEVQKDGVTTTATCRWLVNASGRNCAAWPVFEEISPASPDPDLHTAGAWGRFSNVRDIDSLGDDDWRKKVGYTSRYLSTNHCMGRGFWIWAIPIDRGIVSWGIVYDKDVLGEDLTGRDEFLAFLMAQPLVKELIGEAEMLDFQSHPSLPFKRKTFCSAQRWAVVGDTHGFIDPFYSPGSDVLSRQAYLLEHLVTEKDEKQLEKTVATINDYTYYEYRLLRLLYVNQYDGFGSYEVFNIKSLWDFHSYTNRMVWNFYTQKYADLNWMQREIDGQETTLRLTRAVQNGFTELSAYLTQMGLYDRQNCGEYSLRQNRFRIEEEILTDYDDDRAVQNHMYLCRLTISELIECRFELSGFLSKKFIQNQLTFASMSQFELNKSWLNSFLERASTKLCRILKTHFQKDLDLKITPECLQKKLPSSLEKKEESVRDFIAEIWNEPAINPVEKSLIGT
jgi:flavin-dependent dehydrogenase